MNGPYRSFHVPAAVPAHPAFVAIAELDLACTYAMRRPALAEECAVTALRAALVAGRVDLVERAYALIAAL